MATDLPDLLTVEEAAVVLRIGRTKAYSLTREWRATDGRIGLAVVEFGHALRVPRHALEAMIGAQLTGPAPKPPVPRPSPDTESRAERGIGERRGREELPKVPAPPAARVAPSASSDDPKESAGSSTVTPIRRRRRSTTSDQLALFGPPASV